MLKQQIQGDVVVALKAKDSKKTNILRGIISQVKNIEIDKKAELTDEEVVAVIKKQVKVLLEAKEMFENGGRADLAVENEEEINMLKVYLPAEVSDANLEEKVKAVLLKNDANTNIGQVIGICIKELKGMGDASKIAELVKKLRS
ncbi:MAG: GatB/YqeY domain-containing protein [Patescibacteria group bacterium]